MITRIARKEIVDLWRDGRFRVASAIVAVLLVAALLNGWREHQAVAAERAAAVEATWSDWLAQGEKGPHSAAHYGTYAFKPATATTFVDHGVNPYVGVFTWLEAHRQNAFRNRPAQDQTALARFGDWTAATVLQLLLPLVIVMVTFTAVAGEREDGTLRQLLSLGVRSRAIVVGKAMGLAGGLAMLLVPAVALGVVAMALAGGSDVLGAGAPRLLLLGMGYIAYLAIFLLLALAASARARSPRVALVALIAFWAFNALIAPRAAADVARSLAPTPTLLDFNLAIERDLAGGSGDRDPVQERLSALEQQLFREHGVTRREDLPVDFGGYSLQANEEHGDEVFDSHYGALHATLSRQELIHQTAGLLAPLVAMRTLSMGLAGTDYAQHHDFAQAAEQYRRRLVAKLNMDQAEHGRSASPGRPYLADERLWASVPAFTYEPPPAIWVLAHQRRSLVALGGWLVASLLLVGVASRQLPVDARGAA